MTRDRSCVKSKGLVVVGFVLIVAFILWALMTFFVVPQVSMRAGHTEISGIDPEDAIDLFMLISILLLKLTYIVDP